MRSPRRRPPAIDKEAGLIHLTTLLAHSSGEWMSSDWPVCAVSDTSAPHRMGAALTYAQRYALFTLVGIAGEDDLDAPEPRAASVSGLSDAGMPESMNGHGLAGSPVTRPDRVPRSASAANPRLQEQLSAVLRDELLGSLAKLNAATELDRWALECMPRKNALAAADAEQIEKAFSPEPLPLLRQTSYRPVRSTNASWRLVNCAAFATSRIFASSRNRPVWSVAANPPMPITSALPSRAAWG
jgi:hypothetical protein